MRCRAAAFSTSSSASSCAEPMCSMSRDPCREECTICTAVAPDAVFTVRTYGATTDSPKNAGGRTGTARSAVDRALAEATDRLRRAALLPAHVEIALEANDVEAAATAAEELATIASLYGTPVLRAEAGRSRGAVRLATGDARGALAALRDAWQVWRDLDAPDEAAKVRVLTGQGAARWAMRTRRCSSWTRRAACLPSLASDLTSPGRTRSPGRRRTQRRHTARARAAGAPAARGRQDQPRHRRRPGAGGKDSRRHLSNILPN